MRFTLVIYRVGCVYAVPDVRGIRGVCVVRDGNPVLWVVGNKVCLFNLVVCVSRSGPIFAIPEHTIFVI